jgi:Domain of unknown function (DUF4279)
MTSIRQDALLTYVFLRIEHDTTEPEVVTETLGVTPTSSAKRGQTLNDGNREPYPWNVWVLSSAYTVASRKSQDHFQWLLVSIGSRGFELKKLREQGFRVNVYCYWMASRGYGGPDLPLDIIRGLADLGVDLYFDLGFLKDSENIALGTQQIP